MSGQKLGSGGDYGLAWYSNTTTLKPCEGTNNLSINDLYIEGIDYLQVFGSGTKKRKSKRFILNDLDRPTRMYKKSYLVTDEKLNIKVCIMNCEPASPVIPQGSVSIKFDNQLLYLKIFNQKYIKAFFNSVGFKLKYISRLDIYRDFQKFKSVMPYELIENFAKENWLCLSRAKFNMIGVNNAGGLSYQYLRNGKKNSGRQFYLYNKSIELKEVGIKEHIIQTWSIAGFNQSIDVWRLELSMTREKRNIVLRDDTGELEDMQIKNIFNKSYLKRCFEGGLRSSFKFVVNQVTIKKRKTRCKRVTLFSKNCRNIRLVFGGSQVDKLRMRKIIVKSLIIDLMSDIEKREHKTRSINEQIKSIESYVTDQNIWQHFLRIIWNVSKEKKTEYYEDLSQFIYNYYAKLGGY